MANELNFNVIDVAPTDYTEITDYYPSRPYEEGENQYQSGRFAWVKTQICVYQWNHLDLHQSKIIRIFAYRYKKGLTTEKQVN